MTLQQESIAQTEDGPGNLGIPRNVEERGFTSGISCHTSFISHSQSEDFQSQNDFSLSEMLSDSTIGQPRGSGLYSSAQRGERDSQGPRVALSVRRHKTIKGHRVTGSL